MTWAAWLTLIGLNLMGAASPGPDIILITRTATRSRRHAIAVTAGIQTGVLMWCTLTVLGAAALLGTYPEILGGVQVLGGSWLGYMGIRMICSGIAERRTPPSTLDDAETRLGSLSSAYRYGLTTNLSNPKIVLFLAALIAPLLPRDPSACLALAVIAALTIPSAMLQFSLATVVSTTAVRRRLLRAGPYIDIGAGIFFLAAAVAVIAAGVRDLAG